MRPSARVDAAQRIADRVRILRLFRGLRRVELGRVLGAPETVAGGVRGVEGHGTDVELERGDELHEAIRLLGRLALRVRGELRERAHALHRVRVRREAGARKDIGRCHAVVAAQPVGNHETVRQRARRPGDEVVVEAHALAARRRAARRRSARGYGSGCGRSRGCRGRRVSGRSRCWSTPSARSPARRSSCPQSRRGPRARRGSAARPRRCRDRSAATSRRRCRRGRCARARRRPTRTLRSRMPRSRRCGNARS